MLSHLGIIMVFVLHLVSEALTGCHCADLISCHALPVCRKNCNTGGGFCYAHIINFSTGLIICSTFQWSFLVSSIVVEYDPTAYDGFSAVPAGLFSFSYILFANTWLMPFEIDFEITQSTSVFNLDIALFEILYSCTVA